ncbi:MAG: N,N-dimethylformamidase beta subunit family domain-containing protein [Actinomycetota bacterium]
MLSAYTWPQSTVPGEPIGLRVSSDTGPFEVTVTKEGAERTVVWRGVGVAAHLPTPVDASARGCGWPVTLEIPVGTDWRSAYYSVTVTAASERADAFLVVRPAPGGAKAPILLVLSTATWNAYNDWGGPSLYTGGTQVSFERPMAPGFLVKPEPARRKAQPPDSADPEARYFFEWAEPLGLSVWSGGAGWWNWERVITSWAQENGFDLDVATSQDLEFHPDVLDGHRLFLCAGHDEYWSWGMRDTLDAFTGAGGNAAILSGNTCYWQVRFEDDGRTMVGYKYGADDDPVIGTPNERLLTSAWVDRRIGRSEFSSIGLSFSRGGYSRYGRGTPRSSGGFTVWRPEHWAMEGANLSYGDALGQADTICAYEVDGCELQLVDGRPVPTYRDGAPNSLEVLASAPARLWSQDEQPSRYRHEPGELESVARTIHGDGWEAELYRYRYTHAVVAAFETPGGGAVFNTGCTDWTYGLEGRDPAVERITKNVLTRLSR